MNRGFFRTCLLLAATTLGVAAGPAEAMVACTVASCCSAADQCQLNSAFCCAQSPRQTACAGKISCQREQPPSTNPLMAGSGTDHPRAGFLGPLSADSRGFGTDDLLKLHRPAGQVD